MYGEPCFKSWCHKCGKTRDRPSTSLTIPTKLHENGSYFFVSSTSTILNFCQATFVRLPSVVNAIWMHAAQINPWFSSVNHYKFRRPDNHHSAFLHAQVCAEMFRISLEWYRRLLVHVCTVRLSVCGTPCKRMSSDSLLSRRLHLDVSAASMTCPAAGSRKSPQKLPYMALRRAEPVNK